MSNRGDVPSVDDVFASSDRTCPVGSQECHQFGYLFWPVGASEWNSAKCIHQSLPRGGCVSARLRCQPLDESLRSFGFGESGRNTVHTHPM